MDLTHYAFSNCVGAFFEMPTSDARKILPSHLQPMEIQHSRSVLAVTAFEFTESEVGPYRELVLAVIVPPRVEPGKPLPKAAFYPFMVGTTTEASRLHAIERWHLPHYMSDLDIRMEQSDGTMDVHALDRGRPVLDMVVTEYRYEPVRFLYNTFMADEHGRYKANIYMAAPHSEHEEERGDLTLHPHPMTEMLSVDDIATYPFREEWYREGMQTFEPLETI